MTAKLILALYVAEAVLFLLTVEFGINQCYNGPLADGQGQAEPKSFDIYCQKSTFTLLNSASISFLLWGF